MQQIFFLTTSIIIFCYIIYLAVSAISKGSKAKSELIEESSGDKENNLSNELFQLNELFKSGALNKEEFEKAKKKLLDN